MAEQVTPAAARRAEQRERVAAWRERERDKKRRSEAAEAGLRPLFGGDPPPVERRPPVADRVPPPPVGGSVPTPAPKAAEGGRSAAELAAWMEGRLRVTEGPRAGEPWQVLEWQRACLESLAEPGVHEVALTLARGNGKSSFAAAAALACIAGPWRIARGEVTVVASSLEQARIVADHVEHGLRAMGRDGDYAIKHAPVPVIQHKISGARMVAIGSDPKRAHGRAPVLVIADEPAQWERSRADKMVAALRTGLGKQPESRMLVLGTRPADAGHFFSRMLEPAEGRRVHCFSASPDADVADRETWRAANPSLAHFPALEAQIQRESVEAAEDPMRLAEFRALRLNAGVAETAAAMLISADLWQAVEAAELPPREGPMVLGVDLGTGAAMSAAAGFWPRSGRLEAVAAFPADPDLAERGRGDGVGDEYLRMADEGGLWTLPGRSVSIQAFVERVAAEFGRPAVVVADRWREKELADALTAGGIPGGMLEARGMGFRDGAEDVRDFRRAVADRALRVRPSLLVRAALREARTVSDPAGNAKLAKGGEGKRRASARDDVAAAIVLAVAAGVRRERVSSGRPKRRALRVLVA